MPLTLALISDAFPAEKRGAAIGIWGGITGLGVAAGAVLMAGFVAWEALGGVFGVAALAPGKAPAAIR
jgi:nitrate/nitrite transporter NarK